MKMMMHPLYNLDQSVPAWYNLAFYTCIYAYCVKIYQVERSDLDITVADYHGSDRCRVFSMESIKLRKNLLKKCISVFNQKTTEVLYR